MRLFIISTLTFLQQRCIDGSILTGKLRNRLLTCRERELEKQAMIKRFYKHVNEE